jgi:hypothetical protein
MAASRHLEAERPVAIVVVGMSQFPPSLSIMRAPRPQVVLFYSRIVMLCLAFVRQRACIAAFGKSQMS